MQKLLFFGLLLSSIFIFSQEQPKDLQFNTAFVDAENQYIVMPIKPEQSEFMFGLVYFDQHSGYNFQYLGDFKLENGKYLKIPKENETSGMWIYRWDHLGLKVALLPKNRIAELGLETTPSFLESYKSSDPIEEQIVNKASSMNGAGVSNLALPHLEKLDKENYKSAKFFFELAFAYNALGKFAEAEKTSEKAINNGFLDDLIRKEYLFALVNQNKLDVAEKFLNANLEKYENEDNKVESIINFIALNNHFKKKDQAKKWLQILKSEVATDRYQKQIEQLEKLVNSND